jgi:hypothetical protein
LLTAHENRHILALMKNVGVVIAAVIIILVVAVGGMFFLKASKAPTMPKPTITTAPAQALKTNSVTGTIVGLLSGGKTLTCTITYPNNKGTGTVFVADKKFAGDFTMKGTDGKETNGHIISDGTYMYMWSSGLSTGMKISLAAARSAANNAQVNQSININQNVNMQCGAWIADASKFTVPTDVTFRDMSQLFQPAQPQTGTQTGTSPCDQVPVGPARTACQNAMQSSGQ